MASEYRSYNQFMDVPEDVRAYLRYLAVVKNRSEKTIYEYYLDLRTFFRFMFNYKGLNTSSLSDEHLPLNKIDTEFIRSITKSDVFEFVYYIKEDLENKASARARKLSAVKGFFFYMTSTAEKLSKDPARDVSAPNIRRPLPKYLSLDESLELLKNIQSDFFSRDYCMILLFLNCGMRLSELVGINISKVKDNTIRILGKGNKERLVYLNDSCISAINDYLKERSSLPKIIDSDAMFLSKRTGKRLSGRRVEQIVEAALKQAGLSGRGYSPHKLRHTAATLMYQYGGADMLALQQILGHSNVSTTQIYTHINEAKLSDIAEQNPLSNV